jgi:hypothetical protein
MVTNYEQSSQSNYIEPSPLIDDSFRIKLEFQIDDDYDEKRQFNILFDNQENNDLFPDDEFNKENQKNYNSEEQREMNLRPIDKPSKIISEHMNKIKNDENKCNAKVLSFNEEEESHLNNIEIVISNNISSDDTKNHLLNCFKIKDAFNKKIIQSKFNQWKKILPFQRNSTIGDDKKKLFVIFNLFNPRKEKAINYTIKEENKENRIFGIVATKRKQKSDDVRKKIKARFLKILKNKINENLKRVNSEKLFDYLPQCFVKCINKKQNNKEILNMTFKELISTNFYEKYKINDGKNTNNKTNNKKLLNKKRCINPDLVKYQNNIEVLQYLENNEKIYKSSNFDIIGKMTFRNLYEKYLESNEFEDDILKLIEIEEKKIIQARRILKNI